MVEKVQKLVDVQEVNVRERESYLEGQVFSLQKDGVLLESRVGQLEARVQASIDLTDDLVSISANTVAVTEARLDKTLDQADMVLEQAGFMLSTFLVIVSFVVAIVGVVVTWFLSRRRDQMLKEAIDDMAKRIKKDEDFKREFITALVSHDELRDNINYAIDKVVREIREENGAAASAEDLDDLKDQIEGGEESEHKTNGLVGRLMSYWRAWRERT